VNDLESAVVSAKEHAAKADNTIRVACVPSCLSALLPQAIRKFKDQRADTGFAIEDVVHDRVLNLVHQGTVDIGICAAEKVDIDLLSEHLIDDPLVVVYPPDHPLTKRRSIHIADLARYPLVLTNRNGSVIDRVERAFAANGLIFAPAYEVNYGNAIIALVQAGLGVGIAPKLTAEIYGTALSIRTVDEPAFARSLFIISRRNVPLRKAVGAFVDVLKSAAKERTALSPAIDLHDRTAKTT
jgi:DNA-binding transcriptional LysR family regulator